jgi:hypothetical protein
VSQFDDFLDAAKANLSVLGKDSFEGYRPGNHARPPWTRRVGPRRNGMGPR